VVSTLTASLPATLARTNAAFSLTSLTVQVAKMDCPPAYLGRLWGFFLGNAK